MQAQMHSAMKIDFNDTGDSWTDIYDYFNVISQALDIVKIFKFGNCGKPH